MKKQFLYLLLSVALTGCASHDENYVYPLTLSFSQPTEWNGKIIPSQQGCRADGGKGNTPPLHVSDIPENTNLLIMEINDLDYGLLAKDGGLGAVGFYHKGGSAALLLPVPGETNDLPGFAFKEKTSRVHPSKPFAYTPPCIERKHHYSATVKAVNRTGSFDKQKTILLGIGHIDLGVY